MKKIFLLLIVFLISGCQKNNTNSKHFKKEEFNVSINNNIQKPENQNKIIIKEENLTLSFQNNKLIYPKNKIIILFENNNFYSKEEEKVLKKLNLKFFISNNEYLKKYFNITIYPTIVVLDKNKTIKYENFTPYEILKAEGF